MKMDKESLVKNRFWIGLIAFGPLWLIIFFVALFSSGSSAGGQKTILDKANNDLKSINGPKNERFTEKVAEKQKELEKQKDKVWAEAWRGQADLMTWPDGVADKAELENTAYFGQELSINDRTQFRGERGYTSQFPDADHMKANFAPINAAWDRLLHRVDFNKAGADKTPTNEEVWLAQEDYWVQRELLNVVASALYSASRFENVAHFKRVEIPKAELDKLNGVAAEAAGGATPPATAPTPPAAPAAPGAEEPANKKPPTIVRQRFHTPHWRLDLVLEQNEKKELTVSTQTALVGLDATAVLPAPGLDLRLWQNSAKPPQPVALHFEGGKRGQPLALTKAAPLPGFAFNLDDLPLEIDITADKSEPPLPKGTTRMRFRNPSWELELFLVKEEGKQTVLSGDSKLTNINNTRRTLSLGSADFDFSQGGKEIARIQPPGSWLGWTKSGPLLPKQKAVEFPYDGRQPLQVMQLFDPYSSPIKLINAIEVPGSPECQSFNSHRTANLQLKPAAQFPVEAPKDATTTGGAGASGGMAGASGGMAGASASGMMGASGGGMMGASGMMGGIGGADANRTPNGILRNRYIAVTDQVRHMPVALSLVVEQAQVQDVLTAVTNSRLRIQITQVQWKRYEGYKPGDIFAGSGGPAAGMAGASGSLPGPLAPGNMRGASGSGAPGGLGGRPAGASIGGMPPGGIPPEGGGGPRIPGGMRGMSGMSGMSGMLGGPRIPGGMRGMSGMGGMSGMPGGEGGAATVTGEQSDPNLVEVAVYGIAALYERYPPKPPAKPDGTATTPTPAAPAK